MLTAGFLAWETRVAEPLLPLRLFRNPIFSVSSALGFLIGFALFGGVVFLPLFLQVVTGVSATASGLLILPLTAGMVAGSVGSGRLTTATGRYKVYPVAGSALTAVGMALLSLMTAETPFWIGSLQMAVLGLGVGMVMQVSLLAIQNAVDYRDLGRRDLFGAVLPLARRVVRGGAVRRHHERPAAGGAAGARARGRS